jgi:hypothetical protein
MQFGIPRLPGFRMLDDPTVKDKDGECRISQLDRCLGGRTAASAMGAHDPQRSMAFFCLFYAAVMSWKVALCDLDYNATLMGGRNAVEFLMGRIATLGVFYMKYAVKSWYRPGAYVILNRPLLRSDGASYKAFSTLSTLSIATRRFGTLRDFATVLGGLT